MGKDIGKLVLALGALCSPLEANVSKSETISEQRGLVYKVADYVENSLATKFGATALITLGAFFYVISDRYEKRRDYSG